MNKTTIEKNIVVLLFILVLITFSFAQRDTKKMEHLYTGNTPAVDKKAALALTAQTAAVASSTFR